MTREPGAPNAKTLLRSAAIFRKLSDDQLAEIGSRTSIHNLHRGELLMRQGEISNSIYVMSAHRIEADRVLTSRHFCI
jgi:CRP-like cAMP-binding protein